MAMAIKLINQYQSYLTVKYHRKPKLTKQKVILFNIYANVQCEKRDIFTADIYYYITTELGYATRDLRPAAYGGVVFTIQSFKNSNRCNTTPPYAAGRRSRVA